MIWYRPDVVKVRCPECLAPIWVRESIAQWAPVTCPECHTALEVISLNPPVLDYLQAGIDHDDSDHSIPPATGAS
ncbi:MAG: hypothetical protein IT326_02995 [Anaerolineae bacterium]|nr:hypothetical protein [Anaerolineae bacterium]